MTDFLKTVNERVVVYDGAMGTNIQTRNPTLDDYWGKENCSEVLVLSRPDIIRDIHADFFRVGCSPTRPASCSRIFHKRPPTLRGRIHGPNHQAPFARSHWL
jgi:S-methylmethionine-dependent homocysteine/selenocysteine methylase